MAGLPANCYTLLLLCPLIPYFPCTIEVVSRCDAALLSSEHLSSLTFPQYQMLYKLVGPHAGNNGQQMYIILFFRMFSV